MSINASQGGTYCRPAKKGVGVAKRTSGRYCGECKMKVRGPNHAAGKHHRERRTDK